MPLTRTAARWGAAFLTIALASAVNFWIQPVLGGRAPFLVLLPAVILVAYVAGAAPALVVLILALSTTMTVFFVEPVKQLAVTSTSDFALISLALISGCIGIGFSLMARKLLFESRRREAEMAAMLEVVPAAVWITRDPQCRLVTGSDMTYQLLGLPRGENLSSTDPKAWRSRLRLLDAEGHELTTEELPLRVAIATGQAQRNLRMEIVFDTGERRVLFGSAEPLMGADGTPAGAVAAFVDVSELMEKERALRSSEERYHTLADAVPSFVWATDAKGNPEYVNRRFTEYTGLTVEQLREHGWQSITHPDDRERLGIAWQSAMSHGELTENEFRWRCHDGTYRWFWGRAVPLKDAAGCVTKWVDTAVDITERRRAEAEARRLASVIESTPDVVAMTRPDGQFVYANAAARRIAGLSPDADITAYKQPTFCPAWVYERTQREWLPEALERGAASGEGAILTLDGREIPVSFVLLVHRGERGEVELISTIARDISAQKRAEQQLQEESRRKDEFVATLAHELRNPMAPIRYAAAMLGDDVPQQARRTAREIIARQSAVMARLLDDLLDLSRITCGVVELQSATLDLRETVRQATDTAQSACAARHQHLSVSVPADPVCIVGDPVRLAQVFGNLLDNATKYTAPGGHIRVSLTAEAGYAVIRVVDTGIGLSPQMLARVFDMFARVHGPLAPGTGGLGIGLTVVKGLVELHGGTVEVSSPGRDKGSQFTVRLPLATKRVEVHAEQPSQDSNPQKFQSETRVLVVDDNRDAAESLATLLRAHGYFADVAFDGATALAAWDASSHEVILLDMGLPDIRGEEVARTLRRRPRGNATKIIAITGWGQQADRERTGEAGVDLHLVKPVDPTQLLAILARLSPPGAIEVPTPLVGTPPAPLPPASSKRA